MSPEWPGFESSVCESLSTSLGGVILSPHMPNHADHKTPSMWKLSPSLTVVGFIVSSAGSLLFLVVSRPFKAR